MECPALEELRSCFFLQHILYTPLPLTDKFMYVVGDNRCHEPPVSLAENITHVAQAFVLLPTALGF